MSTSSPLVLGTAQLGLPYGVANKTGQPDQAMATSIIREAWENGIKEFDTAQGYGISERVLGEALAELGLSQKAKIITKFNPNLNYLEAPVLLRALNQSLQRLGTQSLYGVMLHREEMLSLWYRGLSENLSNFVLSGRVKKIGVSVYSPDKAIQALNTDGIDVVQVPANILDRRFEDAGVFQLADEKKKQIYIRSVFLQGLLLMDLEEIPDKMAFAKPVIEKIKSISKYFGITPQEMALCYIKNKFPNAKVIFGADIPSHVKDNCVCWEKPLPTNFIPLVRDSFSQIDERILNPVLWPG